MIAASKHQEADERLLNQIRDRFQQNVFYQHAALGADRKTLVFHPSNMELEQTQFLIYNFH